MEVPDVYKPLFRYVPHVYETGCNVQRECHPICPISRRVPLATLRKLTVRNEKSSMNAKLIDLIYSSYI